MMLALQRIWRSLGQVVRPADNFGIVLTLLLLNYFAIAIERTTPWTRAIVVLLQGLTLFLALCAARASRMLLVASGLYLLVSTCAALVSLLVSGAATYSQAPPLIGGVLLFITPFAILRRMSTHHEVTAQTLLGAVCIYLLWGFSFSFLYETIAFFSPTPFFLNGQPATSSTYLFFSYTTLTTVGYGNLVPANELGQMFAMLEALLGQVYLVIIVARLVSLWGQKRHAPPARPSTDPSADQVNTPPHQERTEPFR